jgi:hypothetical protein
LDIGDVTHAPSHADDRWCQLFSAVRLRDDAGRTSLHTGQLLDEIEVKEGPAQLSIGDGCETHFFLQSDDLRNRAVLHRAQLLPVDAPERELLAGGMQEVRAQETADLIGAEWRSAAGLGSGCRGHLSAGEAPW